MQANAAMKKIEYEDKPLDQLLISRVHQARPRLTADIHAVKYMYK